METEYKFHLKDTEEPFGLKGAKRLRRGVFFFYLRRPAIGTGGGPDDELDLKAERSHVEMYKAQYVEFKKLNPEFKLEWPELDVEIVPEPVAMPALEPELPEE